MNRFLPIFALAIIIAPSPGCVDTPEEASPPEERDSAASTRDSSTIPTDRGARDDATATRDAIQAPGDAGGGGTGGEGGQGGTGGIGGQGGQGGVAPDRCAVGNGGCDPNATCRDTGDDVLCECNPGYTGDGRTCEDLDECARDNGNCGDPEFITCVNRVGEPPTCMDIDECAQDNGGCGDPQFVDCANRDGAPPTCVDMDECADNNGGCGPAANMLCTNQDRAAPTCRAYSLADVWAGRARFAVDDDQGQIGWNGLHFLSALWDDGTLYAYSISNYAAGGVNRAAVGLATSNDGVQFDGRGVVMDVGGAWQWTFPAAGNPHHGVGRAEADGWSARVEDGDPAYLAFGPYVALPPGPMTVGFELMVDVVQASNDHVLSLDVFDATAQRIIAARDIRRHEFPGPFEYRVFDVNYTQVEGHEVEFRVFWRANSYVRLGRRLVSQGQAPFVDERLASFPGVWKQGDTWYLVYECAGLTGRWPGDVCLSTSTDGITWAKDPNNPILGHQGPGWEQNNIGTPSLWFQDGTWYLFYHGFDGQRVQVGLASGPSLQALRRHPQNPLLTVGDGAWDAGTIGKRSIVREGAWYYMAYEGSTPQAFNPNSGNPRCQADRTPENPECVDFGGANWSTGLARSPDLVNWQKFAGNPVLPTTMRSFGYDGAEFIRTPDGLLHLYYRAPGPGNQTKRATLSRIPR